MKKYIYIFFFFFFFTAGYGREEFSFNDTLNTFYLRLYGVRHNGKVPLSKRDNPLPPHELVFSISNKDSFYIHHPKDKIAVVGTRNSSVGPR